MRRASLNILTRIKPPEAVSHHKTSIRQRLSRHKKKAIPAPTYQERPRVFTLCVITATFFCFFASELIITPTVIFQKKHDDDASVRLSGQLVS